jgi:hypothetical protein
MRSGGPALAGVDASTCCRARHWTSRGISVAHRLTQAI